MKKICEICYRELNEEQMVSNDMCRTCKDIIGKGAGYSDNYSKEETDKWFEGLEERKKKLEKENKM